MKIKIILGGDVLRRWFCLTDVWHVCDSSCFFLGTPDSETNVFPQDKVILAGSDITFCCVSPTKVLSGQIGKTFCPLIHLYGKTLRSVSRTFPFLKTVEQMWFSQQKIMCMGRLSLQAVSISCYLAPLSLWCSFQPWFLFCRLVLFLPYFLVIIADTVQRL